MGQFAQRHIVFYVLAAQAYKMLPAALMLLYGFQLRYPQKCRIDIIAAFVVAGIFCLLYYVFPACGPIQVFGDLFPAHVPVSDIARYTANLPASYVRNAMPSLHSAWAILLFFAALNFDFPVRLFMASWAALILFVTIGSGEHYITDLVVSLPVVTSVLGACLYGLVLEVRIAGIAAGLAQIAGWFAFLWHPAWWEGWPPLYSWGLFACTAAVNFFLMQRLWHHARTYLYQSVSKPVPKPGRAVSNPRMEV